MLEIAAAELEKAAKDFYNIAKTVIVLFDEEKHALYAYPEGGMGEFCRRIRTCDALRRECFACDRAGFEQCERTGKPCLYRCHMGLTEAIAPIIENSVVIGYLMLGQVLSDTDKDTVKRRIVEVSQKYGFSEHELYEKMDELQILSRASVDSALNIMSMCACYLYVNKIIRNRGDMLSYQLKDFIDAHFSERLTVNALCEKFYISKSKLYSVSTKVFGMGATDYIRFKRLEYAETLLLQSELSVAQIAERSGFEDANYFVRAFKKHFGTTPGRYRRQ